MNKEKIDIWAIKTSSSGVFLKEKKRGGCLFPTRWDRFKWFIEDWWKGQ